MLFDRSVYAVLTCFKCFQENLRDVVLNLRNTHLLLSNLHTLNVYFNSNQHSHLEYKISWRIKLDDLLQFSIVATCLNSNIIWATIYVVLRAFFYQQLLFLSEGKLSKYNQQFGCYFVCVIFKTYEQRYFAKYTCIHLQCCEYKLMSIVY